MTFVGPITDTVIKSIIKEIKKKETREKIMTDICDPLLCDLTTRYYPYFMMMIVILLLIVILLISILVIILINQK